MTFSQRLSPSFFPRVHERVGEAMRVEGFDALLTDDPEDIAYLTGFFFHPTERPVAVWLESTGEIIMLTPALEIEYAQSQNVAAELVPFPEYPGTVPPFEFLVRRVGRSKRRIGVAVSMSMARLLAAQAAFGDEQLAPTDLVLRARYVKFEEEIALHREAARITDAMLEAGVELIRVAVSAGGRLPSEAEIEGHITSVGTSIMYREHENVVNASMLAGGLVYSGPNSAFPHGLPSANRLQSGDTFILSLGAAVGGRFVEGERTFVLGTPTTDQVRYHDTIRRAQEVGGRAIAPGVECREANRICLDVIREAGLGDHLRHRQGHGIGLGMHEAPWLEDGDETVLLTGMVVSNEPGIYIPGHAGYRISDSMLVTTCGSAPLTSFPRDIASCTIEL